jgi:hypothetical protein
LKGLGGHHRGREYMRVDLEPNEAKERVRVCKEESEGRSSNGECEVAAAYYYKFRKQ